MKKTLTAALTTALVVGAASTTFAAANPFSDVPADHWAYDAVAQLADDGVIEGYGDGTYRGQNEITRYEMAQMVAKAMAKDRQNRYATASEFKNDLLTFMNGGVPVAAAFNPLTDLTNVKARKQAEQEAATVAMNPTSGESAATQAFNPVTGQFEQVLAGPNGGVATKTRAEQRAAAAKSKKKKQIIIGSVVGVLVALLAILGIVYMLNHGDSSTDTVEVPDFTEMSNISQTTVEEKLNALGLKLDARDDTESDQTKGTVTKQNPKGEGLHRIRVVLHRPADRVSARCGEQGSGRGQVHSGIRRLQGGQRQDSR